jgi:parvulin-like peptidyl-prolyl isomerase
MIAKLYSQVTFNTKINEDEIKQEYRKFNEEISLYYIAALPSDFAKDIDPGEQEIKDYYDKNSFQFKQPISFNMDYVAIDSEQKAKDIILRLNRKEDFLKLTKDAGLTIKETGLFSQNDPIPGIGWSPEISNLISRLNIGQFTQPIHSDKNYFILRLKEKKEAYIPELKNLKDKVKEALIKEKSTRLAKEKAEECLTALKELYKQNPKSADFETCAKKLGLKSDSTKQFKFGSYIEGIGASDDFWTIGTGLKDGEINGVISMPSGFYVVKVKDRIPVDEKKFEKEKNEFSQKLLSQKKQEYFMKFADELKGKAQQ